MNKTIKNGAPEKTHQTKKEEHKMNREIKFRGKDLIIGKWIYGGFHKHIDFTPAIYLSKEEAQKDIEKHTHYLIISDTFSDYCMPRNIQAKEVAPETVGQFTGKYDKNGKEIYEGDLIKAPSGLVYTVIFGTWVHDEKKEFPKIIDKYEHTGWCISLDGNTPCELLDSEVCSGVIAGNVHDNPSLLKEK